jgi:phage terminase Nu1 subunit (DNA packaging protein)
MRIVDRAELAEIFRVTEKTVHVWIQEGMPVVSSGRPGGGKERDKTKIDLQAAFTWWMHKNRARLDWIRSQTRLAAERANRLALENAERRRQLCSFDLWNAVVAKEIARTRRILLAIPKREAAAIATLSDPSAIHAHLTRVIHAALRRLARSEKGTPA